MPLRWRACSGGWHATQPTLSRPNILGYSLCKKALTSCLHVLFMRFCHIAFQVTLKLYAPPTVSEFKPRYVPLTTGDGVVVTVYGSGFRSDLFNLTGPSSEDVSRVWCGFVADSEDACRTQYDDNLCAEPYVMVCQHPPLPGNVNLRRAVAPQPRTISFPFLLTPQGDQSKVKDNVIWAPGAFPNEAKWIHGSHDSTCEAGKGDCVLCYIKTSTQTTTLDKLSAQPYQVYVTLNADEDGSVQSSKGKSICHTRQAPSRVLLQCARHAWRCAFLFVRSWAMTAEGITWSDSCEIFTNSAVLLSFMR